MKEMIQPPRETALESGSRGSDTQVPAPSSGGFDIIKIKQYIHIIIRRIWLVAVCFTVAMIFSVINISKQVDIYRSSTSLLLTRAAPMVVGQTRDEGAQVFGDFLDTQVRILNSQAVVSRARERLNVPESEIDRLLRSVSVYPVGRASVINVVIQSLDAQFSADFANAIAQAYVEFKSDERTSGNQNSVINLTQMANKIRDELRKSEEALALFKKENSDVLLQGSGNVPAKIVADVAGRASTYKLERMILEMQKPLLSDASDDVILTALSSRYTPVTPTMNAAPLSGDAATVSSEGSVGTDRPQMGVPIGMIEFGGKNETDWSGLKRRKTMLEHELRLARESLRDSHPTIRKILADLKNVEDQIDREVEFATAKYYSELEALSLKEASLSRVANLWMADAMQAENVLDRFDAYKSDVNRLKALLDTVFSRIRQADISSGVIPDSVTILEKAVRRDAPVTPRKIQSIFLAGLIGIAVGIGIVFGLEMLDDSIRYPEDITKALSLDFLGVIPSASWNTNDIRTHLLSQIDPKSGLAEAYRNVRATLLLADQTRKVKSMLISSSVPREGKTTTSLNLAISLSQAGLRVLLVDADMRRGELHKFFGLEGGRGFADVLSGQAKAESVIQRTGIPNLDLVATGPFPSNPAELILRSEFRNFLDYAKRSYDKIVFDGPPVMAVSEAAVLASLVDSTVVVVWAGKTSRKLCQMTVQNLLQRGARIDGCILNNLEFGRVGYYYYSTYYSYYNYDYRYDEAHRGA